MEECGRIQQVDCLGVLGLLSGRTDSITLTMLTLGGAFEDIYHALSLRGHFTKTLAFATLFYDALRRTLT